MSMPDSLPAGPGLTEAERGRLAYMKMFTHIFQHPQWTTTVLCLGVCQLIPIIGPIVGMGYQARVFESLHRRPHAMYPAFDFNRFGDDLKRGIWPFLVALLAALAVQVVIFPLLFVAFMVMFFVMHNQAPAVAMFVIVAMSLFISAVAMGANVLIMPLQFRAGLTEDLGKAFDLRWLRDFIGRVWKEMLLMVLWLMVASIPIALVGYALCLVGIFPAIAVILLATTHGMYQVYDLYLYLSGIPIPMKSDERRMDDDRTEDGERTAPG